jgi:hypothetical protein
MTAPGVGPPKFAFRVEDREAVVEGAPRLVVTDDNREQLAELIAELLLVTLDRESEASA